MLPDRLTPGNSTSRPLTRRRPPRRYMVSVIQYGGRITDDFDQLLMDTYAEKYFFGGCLKSGYDIYKDDRSGFAYQVPDSNDIDDFRAYIDGLPNQESPEIFGLHPNADLTFRTLQVSDAILTILETMPKGGGGGGGLSREEIVDKICEDLGAKVSRSSLQGATVRFWELSTAWRTNCDV